LTCNGNLADRVESAGLGLFIILSTMPSFLYSISMISSWHLQVPPIRAFASICTPHDAWPSPQVICGERKRDQSIKGRTAARIMSFAIVPHLASGPGRGAPMTVEIDAENIGGETTQQTSAYGPERGGIAGLSLAGSAFPVAKCTAVSLQTHLICD
jgi:hypothetical protein